MGLPLVLIFQHITESIIMRIYCQNWDSYKSEDLADVRTGKIIGRLMPRITIAVLRASPGISDKSIPDVDERDE